MTLYEMASKYGREMELYGKSLYWSSPKTYPNTTEDLVTSKEFKALSEDEKYTILSYGSQRKRYGIGCYQERGGAQELYDRYCGIGGIPNPYSPEDLKESEKQEQKEEDNDLTI